MLKVITVLLFFGLTLQLAGQTGGEKYYFRSSDKILKFDITSVFSQIPAFGFELESKIDDNISLQLSSAIIPSFFQPYVGNQNNGNFNNFNGFNNFNNNGFTYLRGYQFGAEGRFYAFKKPTRYFSMGAQFRHLMIRDDDVTYGLEPFETNNGWQQTEYAFFQTVDMLFHQFRIDWVAKYGFQRNIGDSFVFDCNIGIRLETTAVQTNTDTPEGGTLIRNWNTRLNLEDNYKNTRMMPVIGVKVGYKL